MRAKNKIFHLECFRCCSCERQLIPGDSFALRDEGLFCNEHHNKLEGGKDGGGGVVEENGENNNNNKVMINNNSNTSEDGDDKSEEGETDFLFSLYFDLWSEEEPRGLSEFKLVLIPSRGVVSYVVGVISMSPAFCPPPL